jgi:hypothetical protein
VSSPTGEPPSRRPRIAVVALGDADRRGDDAVASSTRSAWLTRAYDLQTIRAAEHPAATLTGRLALGSRVARTLLRARPAVVHLRCDAHASSETYASWLAAARLLGLPSVVEIANARMLADVEQLPARARARVRRCFADADVCFVRDDPMATACHRHLGRTAEVVSTDLGPNVAPNDAPVAAGDIDLDDLYQRALFRNGSPRARARRFFLRRLRQMRPREIAHRVEYALRRRNAAARTAARQAEVARARRTPEARRVAGLVALGELVAVGARLRTECPEAHRRALDEAERLRAGERILFGRPQSLPVPIAYDRDPATGYVWPRTSEAAFECPPDVDVKGVWEIGKLAELARLAWLGRVLDRPEHTHFASDEARRFLAEHPAGTSPHWVSPLEVSIRLVSLLWIITCRDGERADGAADVAELVDAAAAHLDFLYDERSIFRDPNNHVIGEAVGLLLGGLVLPGVPGAATYVQEGLRILAYELPRQIDDSGCSREGSTDYHRQVTEWVLQAALGVRRLAPTLRNVADEHRERTLTCATAWTGASGTVALFGDTDHARVFALGPTPSTDGRIFALYRAHSAPEPPPIADASDPLLALTVQAMSGTIAAAPSTPRDPRDGVAPAADAGGIHRVNDPMGLELYFKTGGVGLLPQRGHAHADLLALQLHYLGIPRLVEGGTHQYGTSASRRYALRGARHDATLYLPPDQADPLDLFKWATDPTPGPSFRVSEAGIDVVCGSHDGYARVRAGAVHRREVVRIDGGLVIVIDRVGGSGSTLVVLPFPLGPEVRSLTAAALGPASSRATYDDGTIMTIAADDPVLHCLRRHGGAHGRYSPRYTELHSVHVLEIVGRVALPLCIVTLLHVTTPGAPEPREMRVDHVGLSVHIDFGRDDATGRRVEYAQRRDGTRWLRVSEAGTAVLERTLKLPAEWGA